MARSAFWASTSPGACSDYCEDDEEKGDCHEEEYGDAYGDVGDDVCMPGPRGR